MTALISTDALAQKLGAPHLRVVDATWVMPSELRNPEEEYKAAHIPGAVFFDIDAISDHASPYPHMLPSIEIFAAKVGALGISNDSEVIVYDGQGLFSAARVWWMFRVFGNENVKILNGGLMKWRSENRPLESAAVKLKPAIFNAHFNAALVQSIEQVKQSLGKTQIADARSPTRFNGLEPEPRVGLRSGHIPSSINVHYKEVLQTPYNTLKPAADLEELFKSKGVNTREPVITSCGSGVTACILALALYELGNKSVAVYDGSWAEWGSVTAA